MKKSHYRFFGSSIFRRALTFAGIFIALQISIIAFISNYTQYSLIRQAKMNTEYILDLCKETMKNETEAIDKTLKYLQTQDAYLRLMNSSQSVVAYHAAYELGRIVDASSFAESQGITYIMADSTGQLLVQHRDDQFSYSSLKAMENKLTEIGWQGVGMDSGWHMTQVEQSWYLEHYYNREGITTIALLDISRLWSPMLEEKRILNVRFNDTSIFFNAEGLCAAPPSDQLHQNEDAYNVQLKTDTPPLTLSMHIPDNIWVEGSPMPTMIICTSLLTLLLVLAMTIYLYREYNKPIADLEAVTHNIEKGDFKSRASLRCKNSELQNLASSFNSMLDMIMQLRIEKYENIIHRQDTELKYYYMQIRPHFYLNALSSMQSMCLRGENQRVSEYIMALSKNIRYMFNAGFKLVPLREELEHIDDYIRCQEILLPGRVFSYIEVTPPAGDWMIPQMMVHTFVENVYKHVVSADSIVTLMVRAEIVPDPAQPEARALCLTIEDDGEGFPEEILEALESGNPDSPVLRNCVGLMNVKMTLSLMFGRNDLLFIKNNGSAGSKVRIHIPQDVVSREDAI